MSPVVASNEVTIPVGALNVVMSPVVASNEVTIPVVAVKVVTMPVTILVAPVLSTLNLSVPLFV